MGLLYHSFSETVFSAGWRSSFFRDQNVNLLVNLVVKRGKNYNLLVNLLVKPKLFGQPAENTVSEKNCKLLFFKPCLFQSSVRITYLISVQKVELIYP